MGIIMAEYKGMYWLFKIGTGVGGAAFVDDGADWRAVLVQDDFSGAMGARQFEEFILRPSWSRVDWMFELGASDEVLGKLFRCELGFDEPQEPAATAPAVVGVGDTLPYVGSLLVVIDEHKPTPMPADIGDEGWTIEQVIAHMNREGLIDDAERDRAVQKEKEAIARKQAEDARGRAQHRRRAAQSRACAGAGGHDDAAGDVVDRAATWNHPPEPRHLDRHPEIARRATARRDAGAARGARSWGAGASERARDRVVATAGVARPQAHAAGTSAVQQHK